jgi:tetratricopeptide (TPR) repeat protein
LPFKPGQMITINIYLRFALIFLSLFGGIALWVTQSIWYGIFFVLAGIVLLVGYLLLGTIQSAAALVQTTDFDAAESRLNLTFFPKLLYSANRAYFFLIKGTLAMQRKDYDQAESFMHKAHETGLPSDNERAMVFMQLSNIAASRNNWTGAVAHFRKVKEYKVTEPQMKEQIREYEKALGQRGLLKAQMRSGMQGFQAGGKRRRPKMR